MDANLVLAARLKRDFQKGVAAIFLQYPVMGDGVLGLGVVFRNGINPLEIIFPQEILDRAGSFFRSAFRDRVIFFGCEFPMALQPAF